MKFKELSGYTVRLKYKMSMRLRKSVAKISQPD